MRRMGLRASPREALPVAPIRFMRNKLCLGFSDFIELPERDFLYVGDEIPSIPRARVFDLSHNTLNPLKGIDYKSARQLADVLYTLYPQGENTLTVRNGRRALLQALLTTTRLDKIKGNEEVQGMMDDILTSPLLKRVLCHPTNFSFNPQSIILIRLNRAELGLFDALALGLVLINHYQGQLVIPDFGFYGRDVHTSLIHENRLIAGVNYLDEVPLRLKAALLSIEDKEAHGALYDDAVLLAKFAGLTPHTNEFNAEVDASMQP